MQYANGVKYLLELAAQNGQFSALEFQHRAAFCRRLAGAVNEDCVLTETQAHFLKTEIELFTNRYFADDSMETSAALLAFATYLNSCGT